MGERSNPPSSGSCPAIYFWGKRINNFFEARVATERVPIGQQLQLTVADVTRQPGGKTVASGVGVVINSNGQLGTVQSSARFKQDIKPMDKSSEALLKLKPVTFRYKEEVDPEKIPQFGLIAEQVEKVCPDLVVRDEDSQFTTVRYEAVNAMLLNEFLKEHRTVEQQQSTIRDLSSAVASERELITRSKLWPRSWRRRAFKFNQRSRRSLPAIK